ncbi:MULTISPECIES: DUF2459 domain-containing protein [Phenylobacterium]|uniref:DUF2459 domain-containing protein n=1 Tax=Phenylobacterium koreense TaxID=266125 RepID=A0ABV2EH25_9CAUL
MKRRKWIAVTLVALLAAAAFVAATARPADPALFPPKPGERTVTVYLLYNWMHSRLVVPTAALEASPAAAAAIAATPRKGPWTAVSYGDARFYRERGWTPMRVVDFLRSMLAPGNPAAVLIEPMPQPSPETLGRPVTRLVLTERGFERLRARLDATFQLEAGGPIIIGRGRNPDALFFQSAKGADLAHQCNHWVAGLLNAAGVPVNLALATLTRGLSWDLRTRAGATPVPGEIRPVAALETPPVYSGTFRPLMRRVDERTGAVTFEAFVIRFGRGQRLVTRPERLVRAGEPRPGGETYAALLQVPTDSLVEIRRVDLEAAAPGGAPGLCGERPTRQLVLGFWTRPRAPYEISMAAFAATPPSEASLCGVFHYSQP